MKTRAGQCEEWRQQEQHQHDGDVAKWSQAPLH